MSYATLMVHLDVDHPNDARLRLAGDLAERFGARVIGVAACELSPSPYFAEGAIAADLIEKDRAHLRKRMDVLQEAFGAALKGRARGLAWRSDIALPTDFVARAA